MTALKICDVIFGKRFDKSQSNLIRNLVLFDNNTTRVSENPEYLELCNVLKDDPDAFTADLQLTEEGVIEIFGESYNSENKNELPNGNCSMTITMLYSEYNKLPNNCR